jgi:multidrug efflux system membrane fusion protein
MTETLGVQAPQKERGVAFAGRRRFLVLAGAAILVGAVFLLWRSMASSREQAATQGGKGPPTVPVAIAAAERRDMPVLLSGLGSVTAFNTVTVKSRVDGQIMEVTFKEGQDVHEGDLLLLVDPRPFQVLLSQAQANLARDEAQLADAKRNLDRFTELFGQGVLSQQQLDTQRSQVQQLEGSVGADRAQIDNARLQLT